MPDLEMLQPDGTWKKIGTTTEQAIDSLGLFETAVAAPNHTPGPWQVVDAGNPEIRSDSGQCLADAWSYDLEYTDQARANARLIAQAPQLLADLIDAATQLRKYETLHRAKGDTQKAEVNAALVARFEATIAAAVGGAE